MKLLHAVHLSQAFMTGQSCEVNTSVEIQSQKSKENAPFLRDLAKYVLLGDFSAKWVLPRMRPVRPYFLGFSWRRLGCKDDPEWEINAQYMCFLIWEARIVSIGVAQNFGGLRKVNVLISIWHWANFKILIMNRRKSDRRFHENFDRHERSCWIDAAPDLDLKTW
jgi:hypothetical protein